MLFYLITIISIVGLIFSFYLVAVWLMSYGDKDDLDWKKDEDVK